MTHPFHEYSFLSNLIDVVCKISNFDLLSLRLVNHVLYELCNLKLSKMNAWNKNALILFDLNHSSASDDNWKVAENELNLMTHGINIKFLFNQHNFALKITSLEEPQLYSIFPLGSHYSYNILFENASCVTLHKTLTTKNKALFFIVMDVFLSNNHFYIDITDPFHPIVYNLKDQDEGCLYTHLGIYHKMDYVKEVPLPLGVSDYYDVIQCVEHSPSSRYYYIFFVSILHYDEDYTGDAKPFKVAIMDGPNCINLLTFDTQSTCFESFCVLNDRFVVCSSDHIPSIHYFDVLNPQQPMKQIPLDLNENFSNYRSFKDDMIIIITTGEDQRVHVCNVIDLSLIRLVKRFAIGKIDERLDFVVLSDRLTFFPQYNNPFDNTFQYFHYTLDTFKKIK